MCLLTDKLFEYGIFMTLFFIDAFQILANFSNKKQMMFIPSKELDRQCVNSLNLLAEKGSVDGVSKLLDIFKDYKIKITKGMTQSLINVHLQKYVF